MSAKRASAYARSRLAAGDDGWPAPGTLEIGAIWPVKSLELEVAPRALRNMPRRGRLTVGKLEIRWSGPHSGRDSRPTRAPFARASAAAGIERTRLWSFTWSSDALVLFNAPDSATAIRWAKQSGYRLPGQTVDDAVEPIDGIEVQLAREARGWAPTCYRVWIDSYKVGWPPTADQEPAPENPDPLANEGRLAIPRYSIVRAHGGHHRGSPGTEAG
jgi:hypothetical protein